MRAEALAIFLDSVPEALLAARLDAVVTRLRTTRPGRQSRRIYAREQERAISDGYVLRRLVAAEARPAEYRYQRPGIPPADVQRSLNNYLAGREQPWRADLNWTPKRRAA